MLYFWITCGFTPPCQPIPPLVRYWSVTGVEVTTDSIIKEGRYIRQRGADSKQLINITK